jgi:alkylation response protein AidB-like acyl-CoA dehydrogenase
MKVDFDAEQRLLADKVERLFEQGYDDETRRRALTDAAFQPPSLWRTLAAQGILGINVPPSLGGSAASIRDAALSTHIVMRAIGRHVAPEPFLSSAVVGTSLVLETAEESLQKLMLPAMLSGRVRLTLAALEDDAPDNIRHVATRASRTEHAWLLEGRKTGIIDAPDANWMIVSARTSGETGDEHGISLFLVTRTARGVEIEYTRSTDGGEVATATLRGVQVATNDLIGGMDQGYAPLERAMQRGMAALCSEAAGVMEKLMSFGDNGAAARKHVEEAQSAALQAASAIGNPDGAERRRALNDARTKASTAALRIASVAVQRPGGAGEAAVLTAENFARRLNVVAAALAPAG